MSLDIINYCEKLARKIRKDCLDMAYNSGRNGSHLGGGLSTVEIFATLYGGVLNIRREDPEWNERDRLIVSKGHCVLAYYSALYEMGYINKDDIDLFEVNGSGLHGHATINKKIGIEFSGGSLGLGLSYAVGVALAGKKRNFPYRVFVILGDGECDEGSNWEAAISAAHFKLDNLTVIIDKNNLQYDGKPSEVMNLGDIKSKFESFGFSTSVVNGHRINELFNELNKVSTGIPRAIIAETIKGKGVSFMEDKKEWHHSILTKEQYNIAIAEQDLS